MGLLRKPDRRHTACALALAAGTLSAGGCTCTELDRRAAREPAFDTQGPSWHSVFQGPSVVGALAMTDPRQSPEFSRNDAAMNPRPDGPILATNEWPERERASLAYARRVFIDTRADQFLFFENESRYRPVYRTVPVTPGDGYWGFWR